MSLRNRVLAGTALIAVVLAMAALVITRTTEANLVEQVDEQLAGAGESVRGFALGRGNGLGGRPFDDGRFGGAGGPPELDRPEQLSSLYVGYVAAEGELVTLSAPNLTGEDTALPELDADRVAAAATGRRPFTVGTDGSDLRYRVLATPEGRLGGTIVLALPLDGVDSAVQRLIAVEVAVTSAILAVLALVTWWVVRLGVRPIKQMTATATAIAGGELSQRVPEVGTRTEAGELGIALNQMLSRIEEAFDQRTKSEHRLRRFVADASHELRTPVTTIRGYAELFRSGGLDDADELSEAMRRTEQEAVRMGSLIDDLLHLARLDQGRPLGREPVDLAAVVEDAVRDAQAVAPDRPLTASTDGPLAVTGDEGRLRQVVANLIGNALVHTGPGVQIDVRLSRRDGRAVVEVADHGGGMPPEVAARAFERFYRADPSRSRHHGGSGLGLAIAQATVHAHGGAIGLDTAPGQGTTVRIELPLDPSA